MGGVAHNAEQDELHITNQIQFRVAEYEGKKEITRRRDIQHGKMEQMVPWFRLRGIIEPYYQERQTGSPAIGLERMLRMYFVQQWYGKPTKQSKTRSTQLHCAASLGIDLSHFPQRA
jgi:IS5 family transposase